jgi:hypothetical protein
MLTEGQPPRLCSRGKLDSLFHQSRRAKAPRPPQPFGSNLRTPLE